ncbi:MAG: phosphatidylserine decarboxylase [Alphaproteobacteria bacterium PA2]|nr:MAG: phosphatidylserine decarboxylase [Alphaproteobacteria bacterium PA2]
MQRRDLLTALLAIGLSPAARAYAAEGDYRTAAHKAWIFALPLIEMANTRSQGGAPNTLAHKRTLTTWQDRGVTAPNNDTLFSSAWIDLTRGPVTLTVPPTGSRYQSIHIMNMYTDADAVLSPRTIGHKGGVFTLVGPDSKLKGPQIVRMTTPHGWMLVRTLVDGIADLPGATAAQDGLKLAAPGCDPAPAFPRRNARAAEVLGAAAALMASDPPLSRDRAHLDWTRLVGGKALPALTSDQWAQVELGIADAKAELFGMVGKSRFIEGWSYPLPSLGLFGEDYSYRAVVALVGLAALPVAETMYMQPEGDTGRGEFQGDGLFRFSMKTPPPVDAFWSLTLYEITDQKQRFLTHNVLDRYSIGDRTPGLKYNTDGGLDIWIGRTDPGGERTANWLPAPARGPYTLSLRTYLPRPEFRDGRYRLPPIVAA